jgi:hypothetical protein
MTVLLSGRNAAANDIELCLGRARWQQLDFPARQLMRRVDVLTVTRERYESPLRSRSSDCSFTLNGRSQAQRFFHPRTGNFHHTLLYQRRPLWDHTKVCFQEANGCFSLRGRHGVILRPTYTNADRASRTATHFTQYVATRHPRRRGIAESVTRTVSG